MSVNKKDPLYQEVKLIVEQLIQDLPDKVAGIVCAFHQDEEKNTGSTQRENLLNQEKKDSYSISYKSYNSGNLITYEYTYRFVMRNSFPKNKLMKEERDRRNKTHSGSKPLLFSQWLSKVKAWAVYSDDKPALTSFRDFAVEKLEAEIVEEI